MDKTQFFPLKNNLSINFNVNVLVSLSITKQTIDNWQVQYSTYGTCHLQYYFLSIYFLLLSRSTVQSVLYVLLLY